MGFQELIGLVVIGGAKLAVLFVVVWLAVRLERRLAEKGRKAVGS
jgi:hypothetical protein